MCSETDYLNRDIELPLGMTHMKPNGVDTDLPQDAEKLRKRFTTLVEDGYLQLGIDYEKILDRTILCNYQFLFSTFSFEKFIFVLQLGTYCNSIFSLRSQFRSTIEEIHYIFM